MATKSAPAKTGNKGTAAAAKNDGLLAAVQAAAALEAGVRAQSGSNFTWLTLVDATSNILVEGEQNYIKGAKARDYVITNRKLRLGQTLDATVIGMFKVYAEVEPAATKGDMAKTVGYWHPADAEQVPLEGSFDRPLSNGHVLQPVHWVFLYLHDNPDIEGAVLSFRSTGNKIYSQLEKLVKGNSTIVPELRFSIGSQGIKAEKYNRTYYYPKFDLQEQRNFAYDLEDGVRSVKGGLDKDTLNEVLTRYAELYKAFNEYILVSKRSNIAGLLPGAPAKSAVEIAEDDDDGSEVRF
jgi:hypothetical protein